jgi:hypothetical protein
VAYKTGITGDSASAATAGGVWRQAWRLVVALALLAVCVSALADGSRPVLAGPDAAGMHPMPAATTPGPPGARPAGRPAGMLLTVLYRRCSAAVDSELAEECRDHATDLMRGCRFADDFTQYRRCRGFTPGSKRRCAAAESFAEYMSCMKPGSCPNCFFDVGLKRIWDLLFPGKFRTA